MGNEIPTKQRGQVRLRDHHQCLRCGGRGAETHHRRRRGVKGGHFQHCACNMVLMCPTCHRYVHGQGRPQARREGFILSATCTEPFNRPVQSWRGTVSLTCEGHTKEGTDHAR